jgi:hypothetical protein
VKGPNSVNDKGVHFKSNFEVGDLMGHSKLKGLFGAEYQSWEKSFKPLTTRKQLALFRNDRSVRFGEARPSYGLLFLFPMLQRLLLFLYEHVTETCNADGIVS